MTIINDSQVSGRDDDSSGRLEELHQSQNAQPSPALKPEATFLYAHRSSSLHERKPKCKTDDARAATGALAATGA
jgi:hypothetical protein